MSMMDLDDATVDPVYQYNEGIQPSTSTSEQGQEPIVKYETAAESSSPTAPDTISQRPNYREMNVKIHIRKPGKDTWQYVGRGIVTQEISGHSSRVVVRSTSTGKILTVFGEMSDVQAEKRGNFVVLGCVENGAVVSWSLNAVNNSETLKLLASIELACYHCKQAVTDPNLHGKVRRKIERVIKDDRRRRHKRRRDDDELVYAFGQQRLV
ncbi:hypothetical protein SISNIDRAFT_337509 [Sistotremastrum niveocremeum HHB9708]|uniref:Uncharacterized protein n=1 Tax=Sistotremastrum niveocremeum HHB9708 TaxID=1314777 RepID=A0A164XLP7_9AGAM|nr:hypothetical protein SISNIDRAFT_337509 [Sistotremastrum niveocremeum HHB9708]